MAKRKRTNTIYKTLHIKNNDREATQTPLKSEVNSGSPDGLAVPAPHITPIMLLLNGIV